MKPKSIRHPLSSILGLAALCLCAFAFNAPGQEAKYASQSVTITNIPAATTNNQTLLFDVRKQQNVAIQVTTTSTNLVLIFNASVNGTSYSPAWKTITFAAGTTVTNLNVGGIGYLNVTNIANVGTFIATNTIVYGQKISAP